MDAAETGRKGEAVAARYYQQRGCLLLAHDYRTRMGEIDLILREPDGTIVLCEVKTRSPEHILVIRDSIDNGICGEAPLLAVPVCFSQCAGIHAGEFFRSHILVNGVAIGW